MDSRTTNPKRTLLYVAVLIAAVGSFAVSQGQTIFNQPMTITPETVFGVIATLIVVVVALGQLFGSDTPVNEEITFTHLAVATMWAIYLLAGVVLVVTGNTGWVVLANLLIAVGAGLLFGYLYTRG